MAITSSTVHMAAACCLASMLAGCTVYRPTIDDRPAENGEFVSMPRRTGAMGMLAGADHQVRLPSISLVTPERYTWRIANLPTVQMHATLSIEEPSEAKLDALDAAGVRITMLLRNERTGEVLKKEGRLLGDWSVTPQSWSGTPIDYDAFWFRPARHDVYFLTIQIHAANPSAEATVTATPLITSDPR